MIWFLSPICVPFGNANFDSPLGGAHDLDVQTPPNTPVTALLSGEVTTLSSPSWGKQVCLQLDKPYNGIPYMAYLHLSAINPSLAIGQRVSIGDIIGWSGGCTSLVQYQGTSNPTGQNFLNSPDMSSQAQTGIALMRGPEYGTGLGWSKFPPVDWSLDPSDLLYKTRAAWNTWHAILSLPYDTGIAKSWQDLYHNGELMPPPTSQEYISNDWTGSRIVVQEFGGHRAEFYPSGETNWYKY